MKITPKIIKYTVSAIPENVAIDITYANLTIEAINRIEPVIY